MRIIAAIYLTIVLVNFGIWLANGSHDNPFPSSYSYVLWSLFCFSIVALLAYVIDKRILPRRAWQAVFVVYLACRSWELATTGLVLNRDDPVTDLNAIASYLWLVLPAALAMWYLGFMHSPSRHRHGVNATGQEV